MDSWIKALKSSNNGSCVEVNLTDQAPAVLVRDSKDQGNGPVLKFTPAEWDAFLDGAGKGEFNLPA